MTAHERLKKDFEEFRREVTVILWPTDSLEGTRFDRLENQFNEALEERDKILKAYFSRPWWRRFLGIGPKKEINVLRIGSHADKRVGYNPLPKNFKKPPPPPAPPPLRRIREGSKPKIESK